ncbi:unnamed protein product [Parascedosporium putredinis]|uniref:Uncharacterized protein n=1 Tax=Parascedosporium putredinis TaxID=1442378 RepID=A0A9P1MEB3_9PEZI|nr:unnamed protein product [Parascedosporium putredinis]CAI8004278.1 unnamed protein product [Parascedosporium putredinis]
MMGDPITFPAPGTLILGEEGYPVSEIPRSTVTEYFYYEEKIVRKMPKLKTDADPNSTLAKLKNLLTPPVVKAYEELPKREGKFYYTDRQGRNPFAETISDLTLDGDEVYTSSFGLDAPVDLSEIDPQTVRLFLQFLYSGNYHDGAIQDCDAPSATTLLTTEEAREKLRSLPDCDFLASEDHGEQVSDSHRNGLLARDRFYRAAESSYKTSDAFTEAVDELYSDPDPVDAALEDIVSTLAASLYGRDEQFRTRVEPLMRKRAAFAVDVLNQLVKNARFR